MLELYLKLLKNNYYFLKLLGTIFYYQQHIIYTVVVAQDDTNTNYYNIFFLRQQAVTNYIALHLLEVIHFNILQIFKNLKYFFISVKFNCQNK